MVVLGNVNTVFLLVTLSNSPLDSSGRCTCVQDLVPKVLWPKFGHPVQSLNIYLSVKIFIYHGKNHLP